MKKRIVLLTLVLTLLASVLASGCANGCSGCAAGEGEISVFYYTYSDTYISSVRGAMDALLREAGLPYNNYDANGNQTTQTEQVDTAIAKGSRMLVVNLVDTGSDDAAKTIVEKARSANLPLIFFNRSVDQRVVESYDKCAFVGTDYEMAGHMQGELIGEYLKNNYAAADLDGDDRIRYVLFKGQQGNLEAEARTKYSVEDANAILTAAGKAPLLFYDAKNTNGYLVDQGGTWSAQAANDYMKTVLSAYSEASGNMVELVIANNDEMALGALSALQELGYNKPGYDKRIPIFGVDATEAAQAKIREGVMTGTVRQDAQGMAQVITQMIKNMIAGGDTFAGVPQEQVVADWRVNIPYGKYTGENS